MNIGGRDILRYGDAAATTVVLQMADKDELELLEKESELLAEYSHSEEWQIAVIPVKDWQKDLTPWEAPAVFGSRPFGDGAEATLRYLEAEVIPALEQDIDGEACTFYLAGYSLAGLFALWAGYQTAAFAGVAAVSPSLWYPSWLDFAGANAFRAPHVYMSLGEAEPQAKNPVLSSVGDAVTQQEQLLRTENTNCFFEWNEGNHFVDFEARMAKGVAWLLKGDD